MKKITILLTALAFSINACLPAAFQNPAATNPPAADLNATAAVLSQQTLDAIPSQTLPPSTTPQVLTPTVTATPSATATAATVTDTQNPILLTLTATLGTGTVIANNTSIPGTAISPTVTATATSTATAGGVTSNLVGLTPTITQTAHPLHSGTMPPSLPFGFIEITNKSKADVYISMRCVTLAGDITIIEYPVDHFVNAKGPAGKYTYVAWVGGRKILGSFSLRAKQDLTITVFKNYLAIK
jgi:hypothetical protein